MEAVLLTTNSLHPLGGKSLPPSLPSFSHGTSILASKVDKQNRIRLTKQPFILAALSKPRGQTSANAVANSEVLTVGDIPIVSWQDLQYDPGYLGAVPKRPENIDEIEQMRYLMGILSSKVYDVALETPIQLAPKLSERLDVNLWLKREDSQSVFSFKLRGAYNMMVNLSKQELEQGVICASSGNHAQGVALAAKRLKCRAVIVMPTATPEIKWKAVERLGGEVVLFGDSFDEAQAHARDLSEQQNLKLIPPFDHKDIIIGQGTIGMEISRQMRGQLYAIFVPIGGGGLIAGIASFVKKVFPEVLVIGVEPNDANSMAFSLHRDQIVRLDKVGSFADGVAVKQVGEETFRICRELIDGVVLVHKDHISAAIKDMFDDQRSILEPAGALSIAGATAYCKYYGLKGVNVLAVTSGANMNFDQLVDIAGHANFGLEKEAMLASILPEKPGSLRRFCELVGPLNISEFKYRYNSGKEAVVLYSVGLHMASELEEMKKRMESSQLKTYNLTNSDLVKDHLRYMMGGRVNVEKEVLCNFILPERPGALLKFLDAFSPRWNISLFHYRSQGLMSADVLVGLQVEKSEMDEFHECARRVGYDYEVVVDDQASQLLMHL